MQQASYGPRAFDANAAGYRLSFLSLFRPYYTLLALGLFYLLATNLVAALLPRLVNMAINQIATPSEIAQPIWVIAIGIVLLALLGAVLRTLSRREIFNIGRMIERDVRHHLFSHLMLLSRSFYRRKNVGDLMNHSLSDVTNLRLMAGFALLNFFNILFVTVINVPVLLAINTKIALLSMSPFVLVMIVAQVSASRMFKRTRENQEVLSRLSTHVQENLSGAQVVRMFGRERYESKKFESTNRQAYDSAMRLALVRTFVFPMTRAMAGLGIAVVLFVGGKALVNGEITIGAFIEVNTRLLMLSWPAISVGIIISIFSQGRASLERINVLLLEEPTVSDGTLTKELEGAIELQQVRVADAEKPILGPISTIFSKNTVTGIVGPSGSGKSTLISCLLRQEDRFQGQILFGGTRVQDFRLNSLFSQVATVLPEPFLFGDSLRTNLTFARPDASEEEITKVLSIVGLDEDVTRMKNGLETLVGEKGVMLSGGQRQRVALARALLAKPKVLVLDDCFSAVDAETETHIVGQLRSNRFAQTVIIVSHRLAAMRFVDKILVLDKGLIVEEGTHGELMRKGQLYPALWGVETLKEQLVMQN